MNLDKLCAKSREAVHKIGITERALARLLIIVEVFCRFRALFFYTFPL